MHYMPSLHLFSDESLYSPNPFCKVPQSSKDSLIQTYLDKIDYYKGMQVVEDWNWENAYKRGYPIRTTPHQDTHVGDPRDNYHFLIKFYVGIWNKRNLPRTNDEYRKYFYAKFYTIITSNFCLLSTLKKKKFYKIIGKRCTMKNEILIT